MNIFDHIKDTDNPKEALDILAFKLKELKKLSTDDPLKLMKLYMPKEEQDAYWKERNNVIRDKQMSLAVSRGDDSFMSKLPLFMVPQLVYNSNPEYWKDVIENRRFNKYPYFLTEKPNVKKDIRITK